VPRVGLTAERVTDAAVELADEVGFDGISVSALARRFGVADASLYSHVKSLREVRERVAARAAREVAARLADAVAGKSRGRALHAFADAYRAFAKEHPGLYAASFLQIPINPDHQRLFRTIEALLDGYGLAEPASTDAVRLLRSTFHGFVLLEAGGDFGHPRDLDTSWRRMVEALDVALTQWTAP
jgi:AcrR family transcriptional regulator